MRDRPVSEEITEVAHHLDGDLLQRLPDRGAVVEFGVHSLGSAAKGCGGVGQAPDLIVLADTVCCQQTAETVAARPAFDTVPAVKEGRVLAANDDIASRWGPRVADFAESVAQTLKG